MPRASRITPNLRLSIDEMKDKIRRLNRLSTRGEEITNAVEKARALVAKKHGTLRALKKELERKKILLSEFQWKKELVHPLILGHIPRALSSPELRQVPSEPSFIANINRLSKTFESPASSPANKKRKRYGGFWDLESYVSLVDHEGESNLKKARVDSLAVSSRTSDEEVFFSA